MSSRAISINVATQVRTGPWTGSEGRTGIDKKPIAGPVRFENDRVGADLVIDKKAHGGYDKAVYAYASEDGIWWSEKYKRPIIPGMFGENLTTENIDLNDCLIGEQWQFGSVILEVSEPRIPCRVFAGFWDIPTLIKEFTEARRPGTYLRIIQAGFAEAGDEIEIIFKPKHSVSVRDLFEAKSGDRSKIKEISEVEALSDKYQTWIRNLL